MKKILVPVDFSDASYNAFVFAERIATHFDATIDVVHVYDGTFSNNTAPSFQLMVGREDGIINQLKSFTHLAPDEGGIATAVEINYKTTLAYNKSAKVVKMSDKYDLVVMGMISKHKWEKKWFGSFSSHVSQHAKCPVLLVPIAANFEGFNQMVYASNWESVNQKSIERMAKWADSFHASVSFIHVDEGDMIEARNFTDYGIVANAFEKYAPHTSYSVTEINAQNTLKGILEYTTEHEVDLLVLVNRQKKWFENLFGESLTKELALRTQVPILVYHTV